MNKSHTLNGKAVTWKIGTNALMNGSGFIEETMDQIAEGTRQLLDNGYIVTGITSGAVKAGERSLGYKTNPELLSAIGQIEVMEMWRKVFARYNITIGQILLLNGATPQSLVQQIQFHSKNGTIAICNENDVYNSCQISRLAKQADNDTNIPVIIDVQKRAGFEIEHAIAFTNTAGILDTNGQTVQIQKRYCNEVFNIYKQHITPEKSTNGTGGADSKLANIAQCVRSGATFGSIALASRGFEFEPGNGATTLFRNQPRLLEQSQ